MKERAPLSEHATRVVPADVSRAAVGFGYILMVLVGLAVAGPSWPAAILLIGGGLVGLFSRGRKPLVVLAWSPVILIGIVALISSQGSDPVDLTVGWLLLLAAAGALYARFKRPNPVREAGLVQNQIDFEVSRSAEPALAQLVAAPPPTLPATDGVRVIKEARLGEISRHFDSALNASIQGWLDHEFSIHGFMVSINGLGIGRVGISGSSAAVLAETGTSRDNLMADAFVAVFETRAADGTIDTVRVVVPSEDACRDQLRLMLSALADQLGQGSYREQALRRYAEPLTRALKTDISYVSDRLNAILRQPPDQQPPLTLIGSPISEHALLGGAIQIGSAPPLQLYPIAYLRAITSLMALQQPPPQPALAGVSANGPGPS